MSCLCSSCENSSHADGIFQLKPLSHFFVLLNGGHGHTAVGFLCCRLYVAGYFPCFSIYVSCVACRITESLVDKSEYRHRWLCQRLYPTCKYFPDYSRCAIVYKGLCSLLICRNTAPWLGWADDSFACLQLVQTPLLCQCVKTNGRLVSRELEIGSWIRRGFYGLCCS